MHKWHERGKKIERYIRPATFPLAIRLAMEQEEIGTSIRRPPTKNFLCQNLTMARRYGWSMVVRPEDCTCLLARATYGWNESGEGKGLLDFAVGLYANKVENEKAFFDSMKPLPQAPSQLIISPLSWTRIEPDVILIYGNAAQMMRLVQSYLFMQGGVLNFNAAGRLGSCTEGIIGAHRDQTPRLVILGNGDRVWGMAQDDELLFAVPANHLDTLIEGLEKTHQGGLRYPIPHYMNFVPGFQNEFQERAMHRAGTTIARESGES